MTPEVAEAIEDLKEIVKRSHDIVAEGRRLSEVFAAGIVSTLAAQGSEYHDTVVGGLGNHTALLNQVERNLRWADEAIARLVASCNQGG